ncbi:unnamed protein product [Urochloa humidicola]
MPCSHRESAGEADVLCIRKVLFGFHRHNDRTSNIQFSTPARVSLLLGIDDIQVSMPQDEPLSQLCQLP